MIIFDKLDIIFVDFENNVEILETLFFQLLRRTPVLSSTKYFESPLLAGVFMEGILGRAD